MPSSTAPITVVVLDVEGAATEARWVPEASGGVLDQLQAAVGGCVDVVALHPDLDMWVHDEGLYACALNPVASLLAAALGHARQPYCGTVVFTGGADTAGRTLGLTQRAAGELVRVAGRLRADRVGLEEVRAAAEPFLAAYR